MKRLHVQLWIAVFLSVSGMILLFCGFWVVPTGQIDNSVLVAYGEVSTFAGALFGVDYRYKCKYKKYIEREDETENLHTLSFIVLQHARTKISQRSKSMIHT